MNWEHAQHAKFALDVSSDQIVRENECSLLGLCVCMWGRRQTQCCTGAAAEKDVYVCSVEVLLFLLFQELVPDMELIKQVNVLNW